MHATHYVQNFLYLLVGFAVRYWSFGSRFALQVLLHIRYHCSRLVVFHQYFIELWSLEQPLFLKELIHSVTCDELLVNGAVSILPYFIL